MKNKLLEVQKNITEKVNCKLYAKVSDLKIKDKNKKRILYSFIIPNKDDTDLRGHIFGKLDIDSLLIRAIIEGAEIYRTLLDNEIVLVEIEFEREIQ